MLIFLSNRNMNSAIVYQKPCVSYLCAALFETRSKLDWIKLVLWCYSLQHFVSNCGDYAVHMVDNLLDILTDCEHSKMNATLLQVSSHMPSAVFWLFSSLISCLLLCGYHPSVHISQVLGCIHIDTSTSPGTRIRVPANTRSHTFQWWPFTFTQVLYEYELPVNFTRTSSFWAGRVFIQPVRCKQRKICIKIIYTRHDAYFTS